MEHHWKKKKHLATWGLDPASPVKVNRHAICPRPLSLNSGLYASFFVDAWWSRAYSMFVDFDRRRRIESPRGQMFFFIDVPWQNISHIPEDAFFNNFFFANFWLKSGVGPLKFSIMKEIGSVNFIFTDLCYVAQEKSRVAVAYGKGSFKILFFIITRLVALQSSV